MAILEAKNKLAVWVSDAAARALIGVSASQRQRIRWALLCEFIEYAPVGMWVRADSLQQLMPTGERDDWQVTGTWNVKPPEVLVKWEHVVVAQLLQTYDQAQGAGFKVS